MDVQDLDPVWRWRGPRPIGQQKARLRIAKNETLAFERIVKIQRNKNLVGFQASERSQSKSHAMFEKERYGTLIFRTSCGNRSRQPVSKGVQLLVGQLSIGGLNRNHVWMLRGSALKSVGDF
jgi:hypothetical protein